MSSSSNARPTALTAVFHLIDDEHYPFAKKAGFGVPSIAQAAPGASIFESVSTHQVDKGLRVRMTTDDNFHPDAQGMFSVTTTNRLQCPSFLEENTDITHFQKEVADGKYGTKLQGDFNPSQFADQTLEPFATFVVQENGVEGSMGTTDIETLGLTDPYGVLPATFTEGKEGNTIGWGALLRPFWVQQLRRNPDDPAANSLRDLWKYGDVHHQRHWVCSATDPSVDGMTLENTSTFKKVPIWVSKIGSDGKATADGQWVPFDMETTIVATR